MSRRETSVQMAESGVVPRKSRGQNFLTDERVADRHVAFAGIQPGDRVLEVGPGLGILTERLLQASDDVTAIELDPKLAEYVRSRHAGRLKLLEGDALQMDFPPFEVFVSNLPYSISTPMVFKLLEHKFRRAVVMLQKEFAERMVAQRGELDYSRLSVNVYYRADCRILETVPASRFKPRPKVDSALVEIVPRPSPFPVQDEHMFLQVVDRCFQHRRKKIRTALRAHGLMPADETGIPYLDERVEMLFPAQIAELSDILSQKLGPSP
jgi:16S rRNA (adenine1518-N6/adenine1519-N6)-dimethyltransferase